MPDSNPTKPTPLDANLLLACASIVAHPNAYERERTCLAAVLGTAREAVLRKRRGALGKCLPFLDMDADDRLSNEADALACFYFSTLRDQDQPATTARAILDSRGSVTQYWCEKLAKQT